MTIYCSANRYNNRLGKWPNRVEKLNVSAYIGAVLTAMQDLEEHVAPRVESTKANHTKDTVEFLKERLTISEGTVTFKIDKEETWEWTPNDFCRKVLNTLKNATVENMRETVSALLTPESKKAPEAPPENTTALREVLPEELLGDTRMLMLEKMGLGEPTVTVKTTDPSIDPSINVITLVDGRIKDKSEASSKKNGPVDRLNSVILSYLRPAGVYADVLNVHSILDELTTYNCIHVYFDHEMDDIFALMLLLKKIPKTIEIVVHYAEDWYVTDMLTGVIDPVMQRFATEECDGRTLTVGDAYVTNVNAEKCIEHWSLFTLKSGDSGLTSLISFLKASLHPTVSDDDKRRASARAAAMKTAKKHKLYDGW